MMIILLASIAVFCLVMHTTYFGEPKPRKSEVDNIRNLSKIVEGYDAEIQKGKRAAEAVYFANGIIDQLDDVLKDATIGGMRGLLNITMGEIHQYHTTDEEKEELQALKEKFESLRNHAMYVNTCEHFFVPMSYFGGGLAAPSIDAQCSKCESVLIVRHPATIARMLDVNVSELVQKDSDGSMYVPHFSEVLMKRCKELNIQSDSGAPPSLGGRIVADLMAAKHKKGRKG